MKKCADNQILNPKTNRCVLKDGKIGKALLMNVAVKKDTVKKTAAKKDDAKPKGQDPECPETHILNPKTKRCVSKNGKIGKQLLQGKEKNDVFFDAHDDSAWFNLDKVLTDFFDDGKGQNKKFPDKSILVKMNEFVMTKIKLLHEDWVGSKNNPYALFEANYLIDYYCSLLIVFGDTINMYASNPTEDEMNARKFNWEGAVHTYEILKEKLSYSQGYIRARDKLHVYRDKVLDYINKNIPGAVTSKQKVDWNHPKITDKYVLTVLKLMKNYEETYYASANGMYRLINLHLFKGEKIIHNTHTGPCNCICYSLRTLMVLYLMGYPRDRLYVLPQKDEKHGPKKKVTHWAVRCGNMKVFDHHNFNNLPNPSFDSSDAFNYFTRNIIDYYMIAVSQYKLNYKKERMYALRKLKGSFDKEFDHTLKTP